MARPEKPEEPGPSKAYLVSFGDTMTALLAFFIVLNSLAEEQSGANLYSGSGSFVQTTATFRAPGNTHGDTQKTAVPLQTPGPLYIVPPDEETPSDKIASGPDENDDGISIIDREREDFERFVNKLDRYTSVSEMPEATAEVVFDYFNKLKAETPRLDATYRRALGEILPLCFKKDHRVEIIVWAGTPHPNAWARAANTAIDVEHELTKMGNLQPEQLARISFTGKPWIDSVARRPVISVVINRVDANSRS